MEIFWRLLFGHMLADFTCQTNFVAAWKRRSHWGLLVHVSTHPVFYLLFTWPFLNDTWVRAGSVGLNGWTCLVIIYATHWLEDAWRIWSVTKQGAPDNLLFFLWDQVIHIVILFAFSPKDGPFVQAEWPVLGVLAVVVTHFATVLIYFVEKDLYGKDYPGGAAKYLGMLERLLVFGCFLLPGAWWTLAAPVLAGQSFVRRRVPALRFSKLTIFIGGVLAVGAGWLGRFVIHSI
jgi:hypothetical protein